MATLVPDESLTTAEDDGDRGWGKSDMLNYKISIRPSGRYDCSMDSCVRSMQRPFTG
eukprot:SAG31_NODE_5787_length_2328_cov_11.328847_2_plen_56_part_01